MAANKSQGSSLALFMVGLTSACAGIAGYGGVVVLAIGVVLTAIALWKFFSIKPLEGKVALKSQPAVAKLGGIIINLAGWLIATFSLHMTKSVGGRMIGVLIGIAISLVSLVFVLPGACNKNAIWK
ncbi:MAG TPA: hypothetical protein VG714_05710 [Acidobacteriaceae bacterium]|nr:hypothetical protein [Acidobacteriaceae bacterium]